MILETKRLLLRPWVDSDAEDLYRYASHPDVGPIAGWPVHTIVENSLEIIHGVLSEPETYAVVLKEVGHTVGSIGVMIGKASNIEIPDTEGEIGYWIGVPFWGKGLIPEAVQEMLRYGFENLNLTKIWCCYFDGNVKSKRVQEKCGFQYHHTNEKVYCSLLNDVRTEHITCQSKEAWLQKRSICGGKQEMMKIRKSTKQDFDRMMQIYANAREFMAKHGNPNQWGATNWPPGELIHKDIAEGNSFVCESKGTIVGTFFFIQGKNAEPNYVGIQDGKWLDDSSYGVIHRLAGDGSVRGIGETCLNWAFQQCKHIRIDTHGDNTVMQNLLKKMEYNYCGVIYVEQDNDPRLAFEKSICLF